MAKVMRTIKFRGMDSYTRKWCYGDFEYNQKHDIARIHTYNADGEYDCQRVVLPDTVGQYTGLNDKNGVEIYEGDVVSHPYIDPIFRDMVHVDGSDVVSEVMFHDGSFVIKYDVDDYIYLDGLTRCGHVTVVGNKYENSELLTQK